MIDAKDITVVVQGPVYGEPWIRPERRLTARALRRVREVLPGATVVLSTWEDANVTGLDFDRLVRSPDPGSQPLREEAGRVLAWNNVNRQIVSTRAGLAVCTTPFAIKMRSDLYLAHARFVADFGRYPQRDPEWTFLNERVISSAPNARRGPHRARHRALPFHPNDWFYFGRTEDLRTLFDIPTQPDADARWFETHPKDPRWPDALGDLGRWPAEVYLWTRFLEKFKPLEFASYIEVTPEICALSDRSIAANLVLLDRDRLDFTALKYPRAAWAIGWQNFRSHFTHAEWRRLYQRYADHEAPVPWFDGAAVRFAGRFAAGALAHSVARLKRAALGLARAWLELD